MNIAQCVKRKLAKRFSFLILAISLTTILVSCRPNEQFSAMYDLPAFSVTAVCDSQEQYIPFENRSDAETFVLGATFSGGTNRYGSFSVVAVKVGNVETALPNRRVEDLTIPAHTNYAFKIKYAPLLENKTDDIAYFDIAYTRPQQGVVQVRVEGSSSTRATNCTQSDQGGAPVEGLDGSLKLRITKLEAATSAFGATMNSSQGTTRFGDPLGYVEAPLTLSSSSRSITLPAITTATNLALPPPSNDPSNRAPAEIRETNIEIPTVITTTGVSTGTYNPATGEISLPGVRVTMDGEFHTEFTLELTTEPRSRAIVTPGVNRDALRSLGTLWNEVTGELRGQRINSSDNGSVVLIGFAKITNVTLRDPDNPAKQALNELAQKSMAVIIYGNVVRN